MDKETFELVKDAFPDEISAIETLLNSGESADELISWARPYFTDMLHSKVTAELFVQAIRFLTLEA